MKEVYCLETNTTYKCIADAARLNNIKDDSLVSRCCNHRQKSAQGLHFCFIEEKDTINFDLRTPGEMSQDTFGKKVLCIELNLIFKALREAEIKLNELGYKVNRQGIRYVCEGKQAKCGSLTFKYL